MTAEGGFCDRQVLTFYSGRNGSWTSLPNLPMPDVSDDKLAACMKCGFCQAFCPMYMTTRIEGDLTRGKIALVENLAHRIIEDPEAVNEKLSRCLLCGSCQANCPSGVKTTDIFLEARAIVATYLGLSAIKKAAFRMLLPNPRLFGTLLRLSAPFQNLVLKDEPSRRIRYVRPC